MNSLENDWSSLQKILMNGLTDSELQLLELNYPLRVSDSKEIHNLNEVKRELIEQYEEDIPYEVSFNDPLEIISQLQDESCCKNNCFEKIKVSFQRSLVNRITEFKGMSKVDKEKAVLLILKLGLNDDDEVEPDKKQKRNYFEFLFNGKISVCRNAFLKIHNISIRQLKRIQKAAVTSDRFKLPEHGNKGRKPT